MKDFQEPDKVAQALRDSEEKYRYLFETMPNGFYRSTPEGYYVEANQAFLAMLGYDSKEDLFKVYIPTGIYVRPVERDEFERANEDFVSNLEIYRLKTKDGRIIWIEDNARYIKDEHGKVLFNEGICRDITDRKHAEEELKRKNDELLKLNMEKDKFFSIIAHDLRSPFNGFLGLTQIMAEKLSDLTMDEIQRFAVSLRKSATNLFRLLENLLEWSRLEQGLIPFRPASVELRKVSEQSIEMITETAKIKGVGILNNISPGLMVFADTNLLQTVLRNLVSNAVKYTRNGGTINLYAKALTNNTVEISIVDSGIGMSPDLLEKLFRLDDQKSRKGTDGEPSTGLGLIICKDFISKHGGTICVESEEGSGSTFYITLPIPPSVKTELTTNVCNVNC